VAAAPGSQRVGAFSVLPELIRQLGADPVPVLASAGLEPNALDDSDGMIPYAALGAVFREAANRTRCPHIGLIAGRVWHVADLGLVGELARNSQSVRQALETLTTYQHLNSGGGLGFLMERGCTVDAGYAIYHANVSGTDQIYDCVLAGSFNFLRELCGPDWTPSEVFIPHAKPPDSGPYRRLFKAPLRFDSEFCAIRFSDYWMDRAVEGCDCARRQLALRVAEQAGPGALINQVSRTLRLLLLHGKNSGDDVAHALSMHRRTLNRRLKAEGTTFQHTLDCVRFEVARQLLSDPGIALDNVAAALGYAGVSPFMRTFHRWTGTTPGRWRRAQTAERLRDHEVSSDRPIGLRVPDDLAQLGVG